jgi:hypothetical protein
MMPNSKALIAIIRTWLRLDTAAPEAISNSANVQFSELGMFGRRAMPRVKHNPDPIARKILRQSDKNYGNPYKRLQKVEKEILVASHPG